MPTARSADSRTGFGQQIGNDTQRIDPQILRRFLFAFENIDEFEIESSVIQLIPEEVAAKLERISRPLALLSTRTDSVESRPLELPPADILGISRNGQMAVLLDRRNEGSLVSVGTLAAADLAGGAPRPIVERVNDGDISPDGKRMAVVREVGDLQRLEYPLGNMLFETHGWISHVRIAPDGQRVAFLHHPVYGDDRGLVAMVDADGELSELTEELPDSLQGLAWSPDGASIWFSAFSPGNR